MLLNPAPAAAPVGSAPWRHQESEAEQAHRELLEDEGSWTGLDQNRRSRLFQFRAATSILPIVSSSISGLNLVALGFAGLQLAQPRIGSNLDREKQAQGNECDQGEAPAQSGCSQSRLSTSSARAAFIIIGWKPPCRRV